MNFLRPLFYFLRLRWVPGLVALTTVGLIGFTAWHHDWVLKRSPDFSFDEMLTAMAGILTSIVVTTFSAVFVALTLASAQFSPRIVRNFFREDWRVQLVLILFVLDIALCFALKFLGLTGMEHVFQIGEQKFHYAETALIPGMLLILIVFPYFIYYIIRNINAAMITKNIATRTIREIESHFRQDWTYQDRDSFALPPIPDPEKHLCIYAADRGYLDHFYPTSLRLVRFMGHKVHVVKYIGSFVSVGSLVAVVDYQGSSKFKKALLRRLVGGGIVVREYRSFTQDINFGIRQLVDIAIKAISPAVNDPTTAVTCLNYLGEIVKEFAKYRMPSRTTEVLESSGVYIHEFTFEKVVDHAFNQIHQWGRTDCIVVRQIIHVLTDAVSGCKNPHNLAVLIQEVEEMELLGKSSAELKVLFVFDEYVTSLRESYLKRFVKTALQNIQQVTDTVAALPAADQALHQNSLSVLESKRKLLEEWLSNQRLGASPSNH